VGKRPGKNKDNLEETKKKFLAISRVEFAEYGYADASTSRIVQNSGMARGSLYYHFGDKNGLFKAVYEQVMFEGLEKITFQMKGQPTDWLALKAGVQSFLDLCLDPVYRKITLIESQAAMTFRERFAVHEKTLLGKLRELLPKLFEEGYFKGHTEDTISIFIFGMLAETGRRMDSSRNIEEMRELFGKAMDGTLELMKPSE